MIKRKPFVKQIMGCFFNQLLFIFSLIIIKVRIVKMQTPTTKNPYCNNPVKTSVMKRPETLIGKNSPDFSSRIFMKLKFFIQKYPIMHNMLMI